MKILSLIASIVIIFPLLAQQQLMPDAATLKAAVQHNRSKAQQKGGDYPKFQINRAYVEYNPAKYIFFDDRTIFSSKEVKKGILQNLPDGVDVVIYFAIPGSITKIRKRFKRYIKDESRLHILPIDSKGHGFWARDALPIPVYTKNKGLALVDAKYYYNFQPDFDIAEYLGVPVTSHGYHFEGGNFIPDERGNCLLINDGTGAEIPYHILKNYYGCKNTIKLPFDTGIGHVDERLKIVSEDIALTDTEHYRPYLENLGYEVRMLPRPKTKYGTYSNSLQVNGTIYLPIFGEKTDKEAIRIYESLGFKVVPLRSKYLSSNGQGSIHCITMTYPEEMGAFLYLGLF